MLSNYTYDDPSQKLKLLRACADNNRVAQEKLYRRFFPSMERMVLKYTQDDDQIIDILNDGFLRVFKKIHLYENKGSLEGWIRKIVYHSISNYFKKFNKDLKVLIYEEKFKEEPKVSSGESLEYQDLIKLVNDLPEMQMKVFQLFAIEGFSHEEISLQLDINKNTSRWYLMEARKALQAIYKKKYLKDYNETG